MKKSKVTIHDISKSLGIDSSTVSRALNDSSRVSKKTKEKILNKAKELGYRRNRLAFSLRTNSTKTIGVIVPRISRHFFSSAISGIEETAYQAGYNVIICQSLEDGEREVELVETLHSIRVDGMLVSISMETTEFDHFQEFKDEGFPLIFFDRPCNVAEYTNVIIDDFKGTYTATSHLLDQGFRDVVYFTGPLNLELYKKRLAGFKKAMSDRGLELRDDYIIESRLMEEDGISNAKKILKLPKVDAVISANDTAAISAMQYLKDNGVRIPEDIAFVGFSNEPISRVIEPSLTTVDQPGLEMGKFATTLLLNQIKNNTEASVNETKIFDPKLIIRKSSIHI